MTKQDLHRLVDALPDESVDAAAVILRRAQDPAVAAMYALPFDDEPYTEEEHSHDQRLLDAYKRGEAVLVPWEKVRAELAGHRPA